MGRIFCIFSSVDMNYCIPESFGSATPDCLFFFADFSIFCTKHQLFPFNALNPDIQSNSPTFCQTKPLMYTERNISHFKSPWRIQSKSKIFEKFQAAIASDRSKSPKSSTSGSNLKKPPVAPRAASSAEENALNERVEKIRKDHETNMTLRRREGSFVEPDQVRD